MDVQKEINLYKTLKDCRTLIMSITAHMIRRCSLQALIRRWRISGTMILRTRGRKRYSIRKSFRRWSIIMRRHITSLFMGGFRASQIAVPGSVTIPTGAMLIRSSGREPAGITEWMQPKQQMRRKPSYAGTGIVPMGMPNMSRRDQNLARTQISRLTMGHTL